MLPPRALGALAHPLCVKGAEQIFIGVFSGPQSFSAFYLPYLIDSAQGLTVKSCQ